MKTNNFTYENLKGQIIKPKMSKLWNLKCLIIKYKITNYVT